MWTYLTKGQENHYNLLEQKGDQRLQMNNKIVRSQAKKSLKMWKKILNRISSVVYPIAIKRLLLHTCSMMT